MRIKKYRAKSMTDALKTVKNELGDNALILSSKKMKDKDGGIEVIAAIDDRPLQTLPAAVPPVPAFEERSPVAKPAKAKKRHYATRIYAGSESEVADKRRVTVPGFERISTNEEGGHTVDSERVLTSLNPFFHALKQVLSRAGVHREIADALLLDLSENVPQNEFRSAESAAAVLREKLAPFFNISAKPADKKSPQIIALVGPTGVGKTTSIAKIAAQLTLHQQMNVALVSIDTYRIGAIDQLRTFAEIAEIPLKVAFSPQQLEYIVNSFEDCDYIFLDTTGRNPRNRIFLRELKLFLENVEITEVHLTLSATTRYAELEDIINCYQKLPFDHVLFTKIDEVMDPAIMLNLKKLTAMPVSYICNGQNIPDDLIPASASALAKILVETWDVDRWIS